MLVLPYLIILLYNRLGNNNSNLNSFFMTQKKIVRTCTNSLWLALTTPSFISVKKLQILDLYYYQLAIYITYLSLIFFQMLSNLLR